MKIKTKLSLGIGLLFVMIALLGILGAGFTHLLKEDSKNILKANYNSVQYARGMLGALESPESLRESPFEQNLEAQEANITEAGEMETTAALRKAYSFYLSHPEDSAMPGQMRREIYRIIDLNMEAIDRKSAVAVRTANQAALWIALVGTFCFLFAFTFWVNFPAHIADPIRELTQSIKQIAARNYTQRVHFEQHNEFGDLASSFNTMAQKLEEYNSSNLATLMMEKKRIEILIENMHDPIIGLDEHLQVLFANEEAVKVTGLGKSALLGQNGRDLALNNDLIRDLVRDLVADDVLPNSTTGPLKIFSGNKEGYFEKELVPIQQTPIGETASRLIGHVIILRNITPYKELDFAKTNFIATVSHEFKTPISSIKMSLQLLENEQIGRLNAEQANLVHSIRDDAERLLKITIELLNMSQIESGNLQVHCKATDAVSILENARLANQTHAEQKHIRFETTIADKLPTVFADAEKTQWALANLISNAIQYSYEHAVVHLSITADAGKIIFAVRDTGPGIPPQYLSRLFDRYFRVPGTLKEGTGLGLAICKAYVEAQGGAIKVDSAYGIGSTFWVELATGLDTKN